MIDIKDSKNKTSCLRVRQLIEKHNRHDTTIVSTTNFNTFANIDEAFSGVNQPLFGMPAEHVMKYTLAYFCGLLPFMKIKYDVVSLPRVTRNSTERKLSQIRDTDASFSMKAAFTAYLLIIPFLNFTQEGMLRHLNRRGITTCYWVVNHDDEIDQLIESSEVQCIMTDRPTSLLRRMQNL